MTSFSDSTYFKDRREEKTQLLKCLTKSVSTFAYGPHGIGKTTLIKTVSEEYESKFGQSTNIDCFLYRTTNAILRESLFSLGTLVTSKSNYELTKRLQEKTKKSKIVVFLDHVENLKDFQFLNVFLNLGLCVCLVSDSLEDYRKLNNFQRSRITNLVRVEPFGRDDIFEIVKQKMSSVGKSSIDDRLIQRVIETSGSNLTLAFSMLVTLAFKKKRSSEKADDYIKFLEHSLDQQSGGDTQVIMEVLESLGTVPGGKLYRLYFERLKHPKSERSFRKYMQALCKQGLVRSIGDKRGRVYQIIKQVSE